MRKPEVRDLVVERLVQEELLTESALNQGESGSDDVEFKEFELELRFRKEKEKREFEFSVELRERELEIQREVKLKELELQSQRLPPQVSFDVTKHVRFVPPFQEIEKYFLHF